MQLALPWGKTAVLDDVSGLFFFISHLFSACLDTLSKEFEALMTFIISDTDVC